MGIAMGIAIRIAGNFEAGNTAIGIAKGITIGIVIWTAGNFEAADTLGNH